MGSSESNLSNVYQFERLGLWLRLGCLMIEAPNNSNPTLYRGESLCE
jgi:hypothetical protein